MPLSLLWALPENLSASPISCIFVNRCAWKLIVLLFHWYISQFQRIPKPMCMRSEEKRELKLCIHPYIRSKHIAGTKLKTNIDQPRVMLLCVNMCVVLSLYVITTSSFYDPGSKLWRMSPTFRVYFSIELQTYFTDTYLSCPSDIEPD